MPISGFSAYRQAPERIGWNLVKNGGFNGVPASEWVLHANAARVADVTSVSGWALRTSATAAFQSSSQSVFVEAGKAYSFAAQIRTDGVMRTYVAIVWKDAAGNNVGTEIDLAGYPGTLATSWTEFTSLNNVAPGSARRADIYIQNSDPSGTSYVTAIRMKQQAGAPSTWTSPDQQVLQNKGLAIYEASTNLAADGDMEAVGTASYTAVNTTLTKETGAGLFFGGAKSLKAVNTAVGGYFYQGAALAAGQTITVSIRVKGGDAGTKLALYSIPSNTQIGTDQFNPNTTDWNTLRASGVIAGGDTNYTVYLTNGSGAATVGYWDNLAFENKAYDTMNADPSGQAFALASRTASSVTETLPSDFNIADFARVVAVRLDHAYNAAIIRMILAVHVDANNRLSLHVDAAGAITFDKVRAGVVSSITDAGVTAFAAGDTLLLGLRHSATVGLEIQVSKNGGAIATYTLANAEAKSPAVGTPTSYVGRDTFGRELDGTFAISRYLGAGRTAAEVSRAMGL